MNILKSYQAMEEGRYSEVTLEDCLILTRFFAFPTASLMKDIIKKQSPVVAAQCCSCELYTTDFTTEVALSGRIVRLCEDCYSEWYHRQD